MKCPNSRNKNWAARLDGMDVVVEMVKIVGVRIHGVDDSHSRAVCSLLSMHNLFLLQVKEGVKNGQVSCSSRKE